MTARIRLCRVSLGRIRLGRRIRYGWAYVAKPQESIAEQIGKAVLFTLAVIAIVAIVIALADSHHATKVVDAFGRTAVDIALAAPDWQDDDALPHDGDQAQMYLEMTLVDNRTGLALWHAHQTSPRNSATTRTPRAPCAPCSRACRRTFQPSRRRSDPARSSLSVRTTRGSAPSHALCACDRIASIAGLRSQVHACAGGAMKKTVLLGMVVAVAASAWRWRHTDASVADARGLVANRIWIDHVPRSEKDTVEAFFANSKDALGLFGASSQWRGRYELFRYEAGGSELRVVYPQTGERESVRIEATRCAERGMDFCLEIDGASRGVKKYYSREGWEVDPGRNAGTMQAQVEGLRARLATE